ncbi:bifunctional 2-polyprenyl-6-hydroxyphenol methylase/3-demethylubiquinol 3-O-methyltransferase UbiG [Roseibium sp. MMSF_3412]|uniref:class I SAM-dependent methyltransferase n=1 Tax=Roseibium sp. MMSF_3412 TaxID=3046712 RepID=UPI00273D655F|nr:class I SAM-dependent methyltransferase [Roseibium sp. MMSF_3412]
MKPLPGQTPRAFWEDRYRDASAETTGRPSAILEHYAKELVPGRALDLGCAKGDDAIWLAQHGWDVCGVDISEEALSIARSNALRRGVADRIMFACHDLTVSFPKGEFDLISAMFLQTPFEFPRREVIARAYSQLQPKGLLLSVTHGSAAPWSWSREGHVFPTAEQELGELGYDESDVLVAFVGSVSRIATGPDSQTASVLDNVIVLQKK